MLYYNTLLLTSRVLLSGYMNTPIANVYVDCALRAIVVLRLEELQALLVRAIAAVPFCGLLGATQGRSCFAWGSGLLVPEASTVACLVDSLQGFFGVEGVVLSAISTEERFFEREGLGVSGISWS